MIKTFAGVIALSGALTFGAANAAAPAPAPTAPATTAAAAAKPLYTTADTQLGDLLDDPAAKEVLARHIPEMIKSSSIDMARGMSLKALQGYAGDQLSDEKLAAIDADLAKLPAK